MEEELAELRKQIATQQPLHLGQSPDTNTNSPHHYHAAKLSSSSGIEDRMEPHEAIGALMDMKRGIDGSRSFETKSRKLDDVFLSGDRIQELFSM